MCLHAVNSYSNVTPRLGHVLCNDNAKDSVSPGLTLHIHTMLSPESLLVGSPTSDALTAMEKAHPSVVRPASEPDSIAALGTPEGYAANMQRYGDQSSISTLNNLEVGELLPGFKAAFEAKGGKVRVGSGWQYAPLAVLM